MTTTSIGRRGEDLALRYLEKLGYILLARNYRDGSREIDLVLGDGDTIVFAEVKARSGIGFGTPAEFVGREKQRQLTRAAQTYLMKHSLLDAPARFDVVEIYLSSGAVNHIKNAFDAVS